MDRTDILVHYSAKAIPRISCSKYLKYHGNMFIAGQGMTGRSILHQCYLEMIANS